MDENTQKVVGDVSQNLKKYLISVPTTLVVLLTVLVGSLAFAAGRISVKNTATPNPSITRTEIITPYVTSVVKSTDTQKGIPCKNDDDCISLPASCAPNEPCPGYSCVNNRCVLDPSKAQTSNKYCTSDADCRGKLDCTDGPIGATVCYAEKCLNNNCAVVITQEELQNSSCPRVISPPCETSRLPQGCGYAAVPIPNGCPDGCPIICN